MSVNPSDVSVRVFCEDDLPDMVQYWFHSPPGFLEERRVNVAALGTEAEFIARSQEMLRRFAEVGKPVRTLTVLYNGERIGFHPATHFVEGESLVMHAHIVRADVRGIGIGPVSYVKAMEKYLSDYGVNVIWFKTPVYNAQALRIKDKLGLQALGEEVLDSPLLLPGSIGRVYRVDREELARIKHRLGW